MRRDSFTCISSTKEILYVNAKPAAGLRLNIEEKMKQCWWALQHSPPVQYVLLGTLSNPPMGNLLMLAAFWSQRLTELNMLLSAAATRRWWTPSDYRGFSWWLYEPVSSSHYSFDLSPYYLHCINTVTLTLRSSATSMILALKHSALPGNSCCDFWLL